MARLDGAGVLTDLAAHRPAPGGAHHGRRGGADLHPLLERLHQPAPVPAARRTSTRCPSGCGSCSSSIRATGPSLMAGAVMLTAAGHRLLPAHAAPLPGRAGPGQPPRIGLGIMGRPMVRNLLAAGYRVTRPGRRPGRRGRAGGRRVPRPAPRRARWPRTPTSSSRCCPTRPEVQQVYLGPDGAFEALRPGWLAIDMSSIAPAVARDLAARAAARRAPTPSTPP